MTEKKTNETITNESPDLQRSGPRVVVKIDESNMTTNYANAFRTFQTPEELTLDFGLNMVAPIPAEAVGAAEGAMQFTINDRVIMNYPMAKRLAFSLGNLIRAYEQKFGEIKIHVAEQES